MGHMIASGMSDDDLDEVCDEIYSLRLQLNEHRTSLCKLTTDDMKTRRK